MQLWFGVYGEFARARIGASISKPMWMLSVGWSELVLRGFIVYGLLIVLLRVSGKRQIGQMAPFDLVLLLVLSNAVQNAMNGGDNSVTAGIVSAATLVGANFLMGFATFKSKRLEALIEGRPQVLVHNRQLFADVMKHAHLTHHELNAALRCAGCASVEEVHCAILENNVEISVLPKKR
jgi:uncharacterized membrane protein YcaP (DUF421 family)